MGNDIIKNKIRKALIEFNKEKPYLYSVDIYEPTLSHRIALHLEDEFSQDDLVVDCEYNKNFKDAKTDDDNAKIRPDIIIHKRNSNEYNCAIFEVKKGGKDTKKAKDDLKKLKRISKLNYPMRVFIGILKKRIDIVWIDNVSETTETII